MTSTNSSFIFKFHWYIISSQRPLGLLNLYCLLTAVGNFPLHPPSHLSQGNRVILSVFMSIIERLLMQRTEAILYPAISIKKRAYFMQELKENSMEWMSKWIATKIHYGYKENSHIANMMEIDKSIQKVIQWVNISMIFTLTTGFQKCELWDTSLQAVKIVMYLKMEIPRHCLEVLQTLPMMLMCSDSRGFLVSHVNYRDFTSFVEDKTSQQRI